MFEGDKGYQGGENITTPQKKPRKGELTAKQKEENKRWSSKRIFVEYVIRIVKIFRSQQRSPLNSRFLRADNSYHLWIDRAKNWCANTSFMKGINRRRVML